MAEPAGLEPVTSSVTGKRSNQLSYGSTHLGILHYFDGKIKINMIFKLQKESRARFMGFILPGLGRTDERRLPNLISAGCGIIITKNPGFINTMGY
jgi:hypothetical protein